VPKFLSNGRIELRGLGEASNGISEAQVAQLNQHLREFAPANLERLRALYREGTGDHAGAATLAPKVMMQALFERYPHELDRAKQRLSLERAGQPAPPPDPGGPSVVERLLRLIFAAGDEWSDGARRCSAPSAPTSCAARRRLRPGRIQSGCPTAPRSYFGSMIGGRDCARKKAAHAWSISRNRCHISRNSCAAAPGDTPQDFIDNPIHLYRPSEMRIVVSAGHQRATVVVSGRTDRSTRDRAAFPSVCYLGRSMSMGLVS
jgi:hypothetical protein